ncbi:50S ribosomal protein L4 [Lujinxingia vulgaris]|uniref:Large ribosomal subunit protein uL4 n=1 Tax=Lujinxingia vulgaris TaxID=2600176 RepID=A0A5C6X8F1_9DELT|nr:50S ribosomal protein L4 [Lujinxingia vulgaris]TXD35413.1 50S ribosomal protein L4 [Lujinxingia vulgaris]
MKIEVVDLKNKATGEIELAESVFGVPVREHLFWEVVNWQRAKRRAGTHQTKTRGQVRGGGRKPWRQKGTGRARQGTTRAPHWVGGGTVFGPQPRDYGYAMPKKKRRAALCSALSMKLGKGQLKVVDNWELPQIKTKLAIETLSNLEAPRALVVDVTSRNEGDNSVTHNDNLRLSVRNLKEAKYLAVEGLNVEDILRYDYVILSRSAVEQLQEALQS